jgi:lysophospholipase L1-like esterase
MKQRLLLALSTVALVLAGLGVTPLDSAGSGRATNAQQRGAYVALGDSVTYGVGASTIYKSYAQLYYGYLQSNGSGVTDLYTMAKPGWTSTDLRNERLATAVAVINEAASDTKAVTIYIGINDLYADANCPTANAPACPFAGNLRAILSALNNALAADAGDETVQVIEAYNPDIGTSNESATRQLLLGSDGTVDCSGTGAALGLNDLIHCIGIEQGATPIDLLPIFDAAGAAFLAPDHSHPNDAGHLAIAKALGGAAAPTGPPPPPSPLTLRASKPKLSRATAGKRSTAWMLVTNAGTGKGVRGQVSCQGRLSGKSLRARSHSSLRSGRSSCIWQIPATARGKQFKGTITSRFQGAKVSRSFSRRVN